MFDKDTPELGPFLWLGGALGEAMAELGGKVGRHTKGDRNGVKAERPNTRIVPKSRFRRLATIEEVAAALFGGLGAATATPGREPGAPCHSPAAPAGEREIIPPAQR